MPTPRNTALTGRSFVADTVFSHLSKLDVIRTAQQSDSVFVLHVMHDVLGCQAPQSLTEYDTDSPDRHVVTEASSRLEHPR